MARWLKVVLAVILVAAVAYLFVPFEAGTDLIKVKCGNAFSAVAGFDPDEFVEITEGSEFVESSSAASLRGEVVNSRDACRTRGLIRLGATAVIVIAVIVALLRKRRSAAVPA